MSRVWRLVIGLAGLLVSVGVGSAQEITIRPRPPIQPTPEMLRLEPLQPPDRTEIREQNFRPEPQWAEHAPALIHPLTGRVRVGPGQVARFGASVWTAPHELGSGVSSLERNGGVVAVGFTLTWGVEEEAAAPR